MPAAGGSHSEVVRSRYASQDDLDEVKGAILGFFRGAGKAVKGLSGGGGSPASPPENGVPFEQPQRSSRWRAGERDGADCDLVTRAHWQMMHPGARCSVPACAIELPLQASSALNCRCCGRLMCPQHCDRQVRLSDTAQPSPRGALCRCCDECYARAAGNHGAGQTRTLTAGFLHLRKKAVSTALLEGNRIEKRLEKLAYAHSSTLDGSTTGSSTLISAAAAVQLARARALQAAEQAVVVWEDDASVSNCPLCHKAFGMLSSRRHHCRLCGRVVCARPACSSLLSVPMNHEENSKGGRSPHSINRYAEIRACAECEHVVLRQRDRVARALQQQNPDELTRLYSSVREYMAKIEETLPTFNTLAMKLTHHSASSAGPPDISRAARIRKQLTMAFNNLDAASKRIVALPVSNKSYTRLQLAIRRSIAQYLQLHMFPLTMLPKPERPGTRSQSRASVVSMESISRPTRTPTPLRMQQSFGNGGGGGSANIADDDDVASLPSSMSTLNLETTPPSSSAPNGTRIAAVPFSMNQTSRSNSAETTTAAAAAAAAAAATNEEDDAIPTATSKSNSGIASSLLSFVKIAKPTSSSEPSEASVAMMQQEESIRQALLTDPGKRDRIAAMAQDEKIASLEVLRDQRQRVLGYISDAQKDRRIEDAVSLQSSLIDLDVELSLLERSL
ncbi:carboxypeptidase Y-deficient [Coemansia sp. RSA 1646]|nr:carboxypeptidase Y-deficient [Coemansia sp. RSA 1646]KAJ2214593.1 carboxypeptidase Y-deficient [Coemansia sp. RSA 487]